MAARIDAMAVLAAMNDELNERSSKMVDIALATVMVQNGVTELTITMTEVTSMLQAYEIRREVTSENGVDRWRVRLIPYQDNQLNLTLSQK